MKTLIAPLAAAALVSAANAAVSSFSSVGSWQTAATAAGGYTDPGTFSGATGSGGTWTFGAGWETLSTTMSSASGSGSINITGSTMTITASSTAATTVTFTFSSPQLPPYISGGNGVYGVYFSFSSLSNGNVGMEANGVSVNGVGPYTNFIGMVINTTDSPTGTALAPFQSVALTFAAGSTATVDGMAFQVVPAPGALALVGAAGLVGARRRRA